jgi:hypothetical protein
MGEKMTLSGKETVRGYELYGRHAICISDCFLAIDRGNRVDICLHPTKVAEVSRNLRRNMSELEKGMNNGIVVELFVKKDYVKRINRECRRNLKKAKGMARALAISILRGRTDYSHRFDEFYARFDIAPGDFSRSYRFEMGEPDQDKIWEDEDEEDEFGIPQ